MQSVHSLRLRSTTPKDQAFLYRVFCSTRPDIVYAPVPKAQIEHLLRMQFQAQETHYYRVFPRAQYSVVLLNDRAIGRLYVYQDEHEIKVLDIALLPEYRCQGIGTQLVRRLIDEACRTHRAVRIHAELGSREIGFYERLGFDKVSETAPHQLMEIPVRTHLFVGSR